MAKTESELKAIIGSFVGLLKEKIDVDKVFLWGDYVAGKPHEHSDINLIVISSSFEGYEMRERFQLIARPVARSHPSIVAWGYTPGELAEASTSQAVNQLLGMMLSDSRLVYDRVPAGSGTSR